MSNLFELLEKISQKPGLYIGTSSVTALRHFLVGYKFARQEMNLLPSEAELDFYREFQPWLQNRFRLQTVNSWDKILLFKFVDEQAAFTNFFILLAAFRDRDKSQDVDPILLDVVTDAPEKAA
jgi:hypothetical protein